MKTRHNKKRNTALVYEALIREATVSILKEDHETKNKVVAIIKKHFKPCSTLRKDLECYRSLYENQNLDRFNCEKIVKEAKIAKRLIDPNGLFKKQSTLIGDINKELAPSVFGNYVPNYKTLATIAQMFSTDVSPKKQIFLENQIITNMMQDLEKKQEYQEVDNLVYKEFVNKFNEKYNIQLLDEQKTLLNHYISSFTDNAVELKVFLNEEISRLKDSLTKALEMQEIASDSQMVEKTNKIIDRLKGFSQEPISEQVLLTILKTQELSKEIHSDGNNS